jgi:hypothetical protein
LIFAISDQLVCNCINATYDYEQLGCSGQLVPVDQEGLYQLGLCSEGEPTPPPTPTPAPTKRTLPSVPQIACTLTSSPSPLPFPVNTTGLCVLPSEEYCCVVAGKKTCITQNSNTCGECACADQVTDDDKGASARPASGAADDDKGASARPASGAAALLAALLMLAASL